MWISFKIAVLCAFVLVLSDVYVRMLLWNWCVVRICVFVHVSVHADAVARLVTYVLVCVFIV